MERDQGARPSTHDPMILTSTTGTRRQFLRRQVGSVFLATFGLGPAEAAPPEDDSECGELVSLSRIAMACRFEILLPAGEEDAWEPVQEALELADDLERQMTVFREDSEISRVNREAAHRPVAVESRLFALLDLAARLARETAGAFDITAGSLARLWRSCRAQDRLPTTAEIESARAAVGMSWIRLDHERRTVSFTSENVALDLGAIGKGYALDRICESLRSAGVTVALVHAGHSSIAAMGRPAREQGWTVSISDGTDGSRPRPRVRLRDHCMATSGSAQRFREVDGKRYGHVIDPRTGWPAEAVLSATAIAPTAAEADALATAFYIMGLEATRAYCAKHPGVFALMIVGPPDAQGAPRVVNVGSPDPPLEVTV